MTIRPVRAGRQRGCPRVPENRWRISTDHPQPLCMRLRRAHVGAARSGSTAMWGRAGPRGDRGGAPPRRRSPGRRHEGARTNLLRRRPPPRSGSRPAPAVVRLRSGSRPALCGPVHLASGLAPRVCGPSTLSSAPPGTTNSTAGRVRGQPGCPPLRQNARRLSTVGAHRRQRLGDTPSPSRTSATIRRDQVGSNGAPSRAWA